MMRLFPRPKLNRRWMLAAGVLLALWSVLVHAYSLCHVPVGQMLRGVVLLEADRQLVLRYGKGGRFPLTAVRKTFRTGFFVSRDGDIETRWSHADDSVETLSRDSLKVLLVLLADRVEARLAEVEGLRDEMAYYERTHTRADSGFAHVISLHSVLEEERDSLLHVQEVLREAFASGRYSLHNERQVWVYYRPGFSEPLSRLSAEGVDEAHCRLVSGVLPEGAYVFNPTSLRWGSESRLAIGYLQELQASWDTSKVVPHVVDVRELPDSARLNSVFAGAPIVDGQGHLRGVCVPWGWQPHGGYEWNPKAWWVSFRQWIRGWGRDYPDVVVEGREVLCLRNERPHEGWGTYTDAEGYTYMGHWEGDSLPQGVRWRGHEAGLLDSSGLECYTGAFDSLLRPCGQGILRGREYYEGEWREGKRHGRGTALVPGRIVSHGTWRRDVFLGEDIAHSPHRVYGIDVSRWQHDKGRRSVPILWDNLRIRSLGKRHRDNAEGGIDYPIDFCFIKASQGVAGYNAYCKDDTQAARQAGILVGHYHYFTPAPGRQQAENFLAQALPQQGDMPPVLDVELSLSQIVSMGGPAAMVNEMREWIRHVRECTGTAPVIYLGQTFSEHYATFFTPDISDCPVWMARYSQYRPVLRHDLWQLAEDGGVSGITGRVDLNVFNGTRKQFGDFVAKYRVRHTYKTCEADTVFDHQ